MRALETARHRGAWAVQRSAARPIPHHCRAAVPPARAGSHLPLPARQPLVPLPLADVVGVPGLEGVPLHGPLPQARLPAQPAAQPPTGALCQGESRLKAAVLALPQTPGMAARGEPWPGTGWALGAAGGHADELCWGLGVAPAGTSQGGGDGGHGLPGPQLHQDQVYQGRASHCAWQHWDGTTGTICLGRWGICLGKHRPTAGWHRLATARCRLGSSAGSGAAGAPRAGASPCQSLAVPVPRCTGAGASDPHPTGNPVAAGAEGQGCPFPGGLRGHVQLRWGPRCSPQPSPYLPPFSGCQSCFPPSRPCLHTEQRGAISWGSSRLWGWGGRGPTCDPQPSLGKGPHGHRARPGLRSRGRRLLLNPLPARRPGSLGVPRAAPLGPGRRGKHTEPHRLPVLAAHLCAAGTCRTTAGKAAKNNPNGSWGCKPAHTPSCRGQSWGCPGVRTWGQPPSRTLPRQCRAAGTLQWGGTSIPGASGVRASPRCQSQSEEHY